jgi:hypothetical protein
MTDREQIEQQIREVLAHERAAVVLSNKLFGPGGLFGRLADTKEGRRTVVQSPLFKEAQCRLTEIQEVEAEEFAQAVMKAQTAVPQGEHRLKRERVEIT